MNEVTNEDFFGYAPKWVKGLAGGLVVISMAFALNGVHLGLYLHKYIELEISKAESGIDNSDALSLKIKQLEEKVLQLESLAHKPNVTHEDKGH